MAPASMGNNSPAVDEAPADESYGAARSNPHLMNTVRALTQRIESMFPVGLSTDHATSVTGEPYVTIGVREDRSPKVRGTVDEGADREFGFDEETASFAAYASFLEYAADHTGTLYWRVKPRLEWNEDRTRCQVYMRCLISSKAPQ